MPVNVERALFVIGKQNVGKSTQLLSMFQDKRFGTGGEIPQGTARRSVGITFALGKHKRLYLRRSSPHETEQTIDEFLAICEKWMRPSGPPLRWNFAGALQAKPTKKLAGAPQVIKDFSSHFSTKRIWAVILSPYHDGRHMDPTELAELTLELEAIPQCEVTMLCAESETANGPQFVAFFDSP